MRAERQGRSERSPKAAEGARHRAPRATRIFACGNPRASRGQWRRSDAAQVDDVLDELVALGYLSDARFASAVVAQKSRGHGERAISATLRARGVSEQAIACALNESAIDDRSAMIALWRRRFGKAPTDEREKARQVRFLQSRGFALSAILGLLREPPEESDDGEGSRRAESRGVR
jgi:regulatory protein